MSYWLNIASAVFGFAGAICWFMAARAPVPSVGNYWNVADSRDSPFQKKWRKASTFNRSAAILTGVSVLLMAVAQIVGAR